MKGRESAEGQDGKKPDLPILPIDTFTARLQGSVPDWSVEDGDILYFDPSEPAEEGCLCYCTAPGKDRGGILRFDGDFYTDGNGEAIDTDTVERKGVCVAFKRSLLPK